MPDTPTPPREGMMATVRNRRALITRVKPFASSGPDGTLYLVDVEYSDLDGDAAVETLLWNREVGARLSEPAALPDVSDQPPTPARRLDALIRASRWSALTPWLAAHDPRELAELPIASPFHGAIELDDFQLVPLLAALRMPRIALLLADDVGLGKTVEAGLILTELLLRRRARRVLILTPAPLCDQWRLELADKFALSFDVVDRAQTHRLRKDMGADANPWRTFPRIITSYHYLRQLDVLQQLLAAAPARAGSPTLPWDLLIVDEAHNLMPGPRGQARQLSAMLRVLCPLFEHKLFLTATPHDGHTRSFTGLLELLDPLHLHAASTISEAQRARIGQIVVRRLAREINERELARGRLPRFPTRRVEPLPLSISPAEHALMQAAAALRDAIAALGHDPPAAARALIELLDELRLSGPQTFADGWLRLLAGTREGPAADDAELLAARRASLADLADDLEQQARQRHAARTAGAWLQPRLASLHQPIAAVSAALDELGLRDGDGPPSVPRHDARFEQLLALIDTHLRSDGRWRDDERLVVFSASKTTLELLAARLIAHVHDGDEPEQPQRVQVLYGGLDPAARASIKRAFNDPADPLRVLLATDAAAEGLNLQDTARLLLHYEIPWQPARLEQRSGRLDRHGQARPVTIFHFTCELDDDLQFLGRVVAKVEAVREQLGSLVEPFGAAFERRFVAREDLDTVTRELDRAISSRRAHIDLPRTQTTEFDGAAAQLERLRAEIDLSPERLRETLEVALGLDDAIEPSVPRLIGPDQAGRFTLAQPVPVRWQPLIDDALRQPSTGALPQLVFSAAACLDDRLGRPVFRAREDTQLVHLGHPLLRHALARFAQLRFPGGDPQRSLSRWTVRRTSMPAANDALVLLTVEELAINELREPFHHWVRTLRIPVVGGRVGPLAEHVPAAADRAALEPAGERDIDEARALWREIEPAVRELLAEHGRVIAQQIERGLASCRAQRLAEAEASFATTTGIDLGGEADLHELRERERERVIERLLPGRFSLREGGVQVFALAVEIRLPGIGA